MALRWGHQQWQLNMDSFDEKSLKLCFLPKDEPPGCVELNIPLRSLVEQMI
ncbi:hypothetical protein BN990_03797 [Virgibacillus salexigens]|uniref:Uncharacterized protein n=1 Tax=Virgibacillus massiliensis TaxID=1462526 RepID=A0A024QGS8_9BACI|nr:hypothetical protein BN990_03797 [Virgibacillus massiliensis]